MPDIGRQTDHPHIRILFVDDYGIEYEQIDNSVLIIDIYSCLTNPALRKYRKNKPFCIFEPLNQYFSLIFLRVGK